MKFLGNKQLQWQWPMAPWPHGPRSQGLYDPWWRWQNHKHPTPGWEWPHSPIKTPPMVTHIDKNPLLKPMVPRRLFEMNRGWNNHWTLLSTQKPPIFMVCGCQKHTRTVTNGLNGQVAGEQLLLPRVMLNFGPNLWEFHNTCIYIIYEQGPPHPPPPSQMVPPPCGRGGGFSQQSHGVCSLYSAYSAYVSIIRMDILYVI